MKILTAISPFLSVIALCAQAQTITTIAGTGTRGYTGDGSAATSAEIAQPFGITFDAAGNIYFVDIDNMAIRKINAATGVITTVAGTGVDGYNGDGIPATTAQLSAPVGIALDKTGNIYITEQDNDDVRKVTVSTGLITTIAGTREFGYNGDSIPATTADLFYPAGIAVDAAGNVYFTDQVNHRIRKINASTGMITTIAGTGTGGYNGDNILATNAEVYYPAGIKMDPSGNIYFADVSNNRIRLITASTGIITTLAGNGTQGYNGDNITATTAELYDPIDLYVDVFPDIYVADEGNNRIRKVSASTGNITTVAGTGAAGYNGDNIPATSAELNNPFGVSAFNGKLYISDDNNYRVREITPVVGLPIALLSFTGINEGNDNLLQWQTASELNNNYFTVERSKDGFSYDEVGTVPGAGNSNTVLAYSLADAHPFTNVTNYRLKQTDYNGNFTYSDIIGVYMNGKCTLTIYPNPVSATLSIHFAGSVAAQSIVSFQITDVTGRALCEASLTGADNSIDVSKWSNGIYFYRASNETQTMQGKFVVEK